MYGFPSDFDCKTFIGQHLEMVCFNSTQIYLHFSGKVFITINGVFSHHVNAHERKLKMPVYYPDFIPLCERVIIDAYVEDGKNLCIVFENSEKIYLYDDPHYESYEITQAGKRMII